MQYGKVCDLNVPKDNIFCEIYNGENYSEIKEFSTMMPDIYSMGEYFQLEGIEEVTVESITSNKIFTTIQANK